MSSPVGRQFGSYLLLDLIARGGMGEVYRARHLRLAGREVALKILPAILATDSTFLQRFEREANSAASLNHPHILPIWDYGDQDGVPYIVMPLVSGGSLRDRLHGRPLPAGELLGYLEPMARALDYAHGRGIVHRDIKPANALIDETGHLYLADFGIAKVLQAEATNLTRTGIGIGTPEYMAPEQAQGRADPRSDIYALAVIAYEGLTGRVPYRGNTPVDIAIQHMTAPLPTLSSVNPAISLSVEAVVSRALAKAPEERPASAGAFVADLAAALRHSGAASPTATLAAGLATAATVVPPAAAATPALPVEAPVIAAPPVEPASARPVSPPASRPASRTSLMIAFVLGVALGVGLTLLAGLLRGQVGIGAPAGVLTGEVPSPTVTRVVAGAATAAVTRTTTAQAGDVPYPFPVTNAILAENYQKTLALAQQSASDTKLRTVVVVCFNPKAAAECQLKFSYFSRQTDQIDDYELSLTRAAPDQHLQTTAGSDYERIVFIGLPWERNAGWSQLLRESYALLPGDFGQNGFELTLEANGPNTNGDDYDWRVTYTDKETDRTRSFNLRGTSVKSTD